jgi:hypothetical protein
VDVHEAGHDHHPARVDLAVSRPGIALTHVDDVAASDHEIRIAQIDMGLSRPVPCNDPVAVAEECRLGVCINHLGLQVTSDSSMCIDR